MGMGRAQHLEMEQVGHGQIEGEGGIARDDPPPRRGRDAAPARIAVTIREAFDARHPRDSVGDGTVSGAAAEIALQRGGEIAPLPLIQDRCGHDHAGGTEAALVPLGVEESLLHRV